MAAVVGPAVAHQLCSTAWRLVRFHRDGVTACLSADMLTSLRFGPDGAVTVTSGFLTGTGAARVSQDLLDLGPLAVESPEAATADGALEARVMESLTGSFTFVQGHSTLRLRRDGVELLLVAE